MADGSEKLRRSAMTPTLLGNPARFVASNGLGVSALEGETALAELRDDWNRLLAESEADGIFLSWEWLVSWWEAYGQGKRPLILVFRRDERTVGIAPLYRRDDPFLGPIKLRRLQFIGDGSSDSDYLDLIAVRGEEGEVAAALFDYLKAEGEPWDVLALSEVPEGSTSLARVRQEARRRGLFVVETRAPCTFAPLPSDWDAYLAGLKPRMRTKVRSLLKKIIADPRLRFEILDDASRIDSWLEHLYRLHEARWKLEGQSGVFGRPGKRDFYERLTRRLLDAGLLRFYGLLQDGAPVSLQYCFAWRNQVLLLQEGFDPSLADEGAGNMLRARVFQDCVEKRVAVYDFLGGTNQHKISWGGQVKETVRLLVGNRRLRAALHLYTPVAREGMKDAVRRAIPESLLKKLGRGPAPKP